MSIIPVNNTWTQGLDFSLACRVWTQDKSGAQRRMGNKALLPNLAQSINHLLARSPRPIFAQAQRFANVDTVGTGTNSLYAWYWWDVVDNAVDRTIRIICSPPPSAGDASAEMQSGDETALINVYKTSPAFPQDLFYVEIHTHRGAVTNAVLADYIRTYNGFTILDVMIQDDAIDSLDTATHLYTRQSIALSGNPILADALEEMRAAFHEHRSTNLPVLVEWSAQGAAAGWTKAPTLSDGVWDYRGLYTTSSTYKNTLDASVTSRSATSPGAVCPAQYCGVGPEDELPGRAVYVRAAALGYCDGGATGARVKFEGPDHVASNYVEIDLPTDSSPSWVDSGSNRVQLDSSKTDVDVTTGRNKIDVFFKSITNTEGSYLYGYRCEMSYT